MGYEFLRHTPQQIASGIDVNPDQPYKRHVLSVTHIPAHKLPIVFHTSNTDGINQVSPAFCQSFDYSFWGRIIPVTYVLPGPHVNRVKGHSEVWNPIKTEAFDKTKIPYTYLKLEDRNREFGQIRMGSTMLNKFLLACLNSGFIFKIKVAELNNGRVNKVLNEFVSLLDLPVIDAYKFNTPSPVGLGMGGIETHLPFDIARPEFVGYQRLGEYLEALKNPGQRIKILDVANELAETKPNHVMHGIFQNLVEMNRQAFLQHKPESRVFISIAPLRKK